MMGIFKKVEERIEEIEQKNLHTPNKPLENLYPPGSQCNTFKGCLDCPVASSCDKIPLELKWLQQ